MAEETGIQTTTESTSSSEQETQTVETQESTTEVTEAKDEVTEVAATGPFSKEDLDWTGFDSLTDDQKDTLVKNYSSWFKDKDSANAYLKATAEANKASKEDQAKKVAELEAGWEKSLKTDAEFGKDYEGNKKKVTDYISGHLSEQDMAEFKKFGFDKSPVLNRMILGFVKETEDAKIVGKGQPAPATDKQPRDRWGNTMFDFTKKQQ
jgi:hypothetical protein